MNFTREPIIETVITPKEGCKLTIRNSKGVGEEYFVEAIEVVSFSNAIFYRSLEKPKPFLLPVSDYEVIELKETKMVLKSVTLERSIKIGGGKPEKSKKKKSQKKQSMPLPPPLEVVKPNEMQSHEEETHVSSSILRKLFPPPPTLIKEKLSHARKTEHIEETISEEMVKKEEGITSEEQLEELPVENNEETKIVPEVNEEENSQE